MPLCHTQTPRYINLVHLKLDRGFLVLTTSEPIELVNAGFQISLHNRLAQTPQQLPVIVQIVDRIEARAEHLTTLVEVTQIGA